MLGLGHVFIGYNQLIMKSLHCAIGVFAHNEERNIGPLLESLLDQSLNEVVIDDIFVISSGSFDNTNRIVRRFAQRDERISLITEAVRRGKSAAINLFLQAAHSPLLITISADLTLDTFAVNEICQPFHDTAVGMVGAHPIAQLEVENSLTEPVSLLWELHHRISLIRPKCGEMVAFRNIVRQIPSDSAVDEATLEILLKIIGYHIAYAPLAIVYNKGPQNVREFLKQRRRVYAGHQWVEKRYNYQVVTMEIGPLVRVVLGYVLTHPEKMIPLVQLVGLELLARILGWIDYHVFNKNPYIWSMISR